MKADLKNRSSTHNATLKGQYIAQHELAHAIPLASTPRCEASLPAGVVNTWLYRAWNRALDLVFALCGLTAMALALPLLALLIYLDSPGPIFYMQDRLGLGGKSFCMYKFRTMRVDAERHGQAVWATAEDDRITRVGYWLRATHMDELPQVVNILRSEMSLIGPRPEREVYAVEQEKLIPGYNSRLVVRPGLTGWAQVMCGYGDTDSDELTKFQHDLYYIGHRSCKLDIVIILKTIVEVVGCHGR